MMWSSSIKLWGTSARLRHEEGGSFRRFDWALAQFARRADLRGTTKRARKRKLLLREAINHNFDGVRASADGVLF